MNTELFNVALSGKAAWVVLAVLVVLIILIVQNPAILSWLLAAFYTGPR